MALCRSRRVRRGALVAANGALLVVLAFLLAFPRGASELEHSAEVVAAGERAGGGEALPASLPAPARREASVSAAPAATASARSAPALAPVRASTRAPHAIDARLQGRIRALAAEAIERARVETKGRASAANVTVAVHVREEGVGGELAALQADRALPPASNLKLVTTAAALVTLGPDFHFRTRFESSAKVEGGALRGDLVVRAGADPLFDPQAEGEVAHLLEPALRALREVGIARIEGDLVLDEGNYLAPGPGPSWPSDDQYWQEHCARCAGFSAGAGCLEALVEASAPGQPARVSVNPRAHGLERQGVVTTRAARSALRIAVEARPPQVTVRGELPADVPRWSARFAHPDPVELFGTVLRGELARGGIELAGSVVRERGRPAGRLIFELRSPLALLLAPINADSNNAVADQLFLALGAHAGGAGDRAGGARAVAAALERIGVPASGLVLVDGSGLSREDRASARQISALLSAVISAGDDVARPWIESLAVAGETGTLADRMASGPARGRVRAKTGWISGASALSGLAETASGRRLVFSILVEYPRLSGLNTSCWKPMQDEICETLVEWHGGA